MIYGIRPQLLTGVEKKQENIPFESKRILDNLITDFKLAARGWQATDADSEGTRPRSREHLRAAILKLAYRQFYFCWPVGVCTSRACQNKGTNRYKLSFKLPLCRCRLSFHLLFCPQLKISHY